MFVSPFYTQIVLIITATEDHFEVYCQVISIFGSEAQSTKCRLQNKSKSAGDKFEKKTTSTFFSTKEIECLAYQWTFFFAQKEQHRGNCMHDVKQIITTVFDVTKMHK